MSAKEMFEKLGYKCICDNNDFLKYEKKATVDYKICFVKRNDYGGRGNIEISPKVNGKPHYFTRLDMKLLQAINKQVEELGWK